MAKSVWLERRFQGVSADLTCSRFERVDLSGDREVRPSLDDVLELRRDRMATAREFVDDLTDE